MPVVRVDNYIDAYRLRSQSEDVHELAARPDKSALTKFVNRRILETILPGPDDFLVDIGCGDASLLRMLGNGSKGSIGIVASPEEKRRLQATFPGLSIEASDAQRLPLASGIATKIVCNAVLMYLPSENEVRAALCEIRRIACRNATIWVGEIPEIDEYAYYGFYRGNSILGFLRHVLKRNGIRAFLGMIRRWGKAVVGKEQIVLNSAGLFHVGPDEMVKLAEGCGLQLKTYFRHKEIDQQGSVVDSQFRYDYLFTV
jgi:hypothetical protein